MNYGRSDPKKSNHIFNNSASIKRSELNSAKGNISSLNSSIDFTYELLHEKNPRQMEILASVHYIITYDCTLDPEKIQQIIYQLKPQSNFTLEEVNEALTILHKVNLV